MKHRHPARLAPAVLAIGLTVVASEAHAYEAAVFGAIGGGVFGDDEGSLGKGLSFAAGVELRPSSRFGFEAELERYEHERRFGFGSVVEGDGWLVSGNLLYHFSEGGLQPYLLGGLGLLSASYEWRRPIFTGESPFESAGTEVSVTDERGLAMSFGGGMKVFLTEQLSLRPQARFFSGTDSYLTRLEVTVGLSYHW